MAKEPYVEWDEEQETYIIGFGEMKIFLKYGEQNVFHWTADADDGIHLGNIEIKPEN